MESSGAPAKPGELAPAPIGRRFCAALIDCGIAAAPFVFIPWADVQWDGGFLYFNAHVSHGSFLHLMVIGWAGFYLLTKDGWSGGGSIGKKVLGLRVVDVHTKAQCTIGASAIRALILQGLPWIEPIFILSSEAHRRLGDRAANTIVVQLPRESVAFSGLGERAP